MLAWVVSQAKRLPKDKVQHLVAGVVIALFSCPWDPRWDSPWAVMAGVVVAALFKEFVDYVARRFIGVNRHPEALDALITIVGGAVVVLAVLGWMRWLA